MEKRLVEEWAKFMRDNIAAGADENLQKATEYIESRIYTEKELREVIELIKRKESKVKIISKLSEILEE